MKIPKGLFVILSIWTFIQISLHAEVIYPKVFPKNTVALISLKNITQLKQEITLSNLYKLLCESELAPLIKKEMKPEDFQKEIADFSQQLQEALGISLEEVLAVFYGELSIAVADINRSATPQIAMIVQFGKNKVQAYKLLQAVSKPVASWKSSYNFQNQKISYIKGLETAIYYTLVEDRIFLATGKKLMQTMVANLKTKGNRLSENVHFKRSVGDGNWSIVCYANFHNFVKKLTPSIPRRDLALLQDLGILDWKVGSVGFGIVSGQIFSKWRMVIEKDKTKIKSKERRSGSKKDWLRKRWRSWRRKVTTPHKGVNLLVPSGKLDPTLFQYIPKNTWGYCAFSMNPKKIWDEAIVIAQKQYPVDSILREVEKHFGFRIKDFFKALGTNFGVFHMPHRWQKSLPRFVGLAQVKDFPMVLKIAKLLCRLVGFEIKQRHYRNRTIYYIESGKYYPGFLHLGLEQRQTLRLFLGSLAFCPFQDYVLLARLPQDLMDVIDYKAANGPLIAPKNHSMAGYINYKRMFPLFYNTFLQSSPIFSSVPIGELPRAKNLVRYFQEDTMYISHNPPQFTMSLKTNFGFDFWLFALGVRHIASEMQLHRLNRELEDYLESVLLTNELDKKQEYYNAALKWRRLQRSYFSYFRKIAHEKYQKYWQKYQQHLQATQNSLAKYYSGYASKWKLKGQWQFTQGVLSGENTSGATTASTAFVGQKGISEYILSFDAHQIKNKLKIRFHQHTHFGRQKFETIALEKSLATDKKWVPFKFKVHSDRISYWQGLKHFVVKSPYKKGVVGFVLEQNCGVKIRNVKLKIKPAIKKAPKKSIYLPTIYLECQDLLDPVPVFGETTYKITIGNRGKKEASGLILKTLLPKNVDFISASRGKYQDGRFVLSNITLDSGQKQHIYVKVKAKTPGSAIVKVVLKFAGGKGEFLLKEQTHILAKDLR